MLTVACVCVPGGPYNHRHVDRLYAQVEKHLAQPFATCCIEWSDKPGWWAKIGLFQPRYFTGRVLYLDLDVTVVGSLDDLVNYPYEFAAIRDYQRPLTLNSSVMVWDAGVADQVYERFTPDVMDRLHGDQDWISEVMPFTAFPKAWCPSYKMDVVMKGMPKDARVCVFHGLPKPWDLPDVA